MNANTGIYCVFLQNDVKFAKPTVELLKLLPSVQCLSPRSVCSVLEGGRKGTVLTAIIYNIQCYYLLILDLSARMMDEEEFKSSCFQCVYQYLKRHISAVSLDRFSYIIGSVEGRHVECLQVLLK